VAFKIRQNPFSAGALPRTPLGELTTLPRLLSRLERENPSPYLAPLGTDPPSALAIWHASPQKSSQMRGRCEQNKSGTKQPVAYSKVGLPARIPCAGPVPLLKKMMKRCMITATRRLCSDTWAQTVLRLVLQFF